MSMSAYTSRMSGNYADRSAECAVRCVKGNLLRHGMFAAKMAISRQSCSLPCKSYGEGQCIYAVLPIVKRLQNVASTHTCWCGLNSPHVHQHLPRLKQHMRVQQSCQLDPEAVQWTAGDPPQEHRLLRSLTTTATAGIVTCPLHSSQCLQGMAAHPVCSVVQGAALLSGVHVMSNSTLP